MSNQEPITVKNSGAGGFDVEIHYNGSQFGVLSTQESLKLQAKNQFQTEEWLQVLEGALDKLKTEVLLNKAIPRFRTGDKPLDDP